MQITADLNDGRCAPCANTAAGGSKFRYWKSLLESADESELDFERLDRSGLGALHWAIDRGDVSLFSRALEAGAPIDQRTSHCRLSPLHYAASAVNEHFIVSLLERGAFVDARDRNGQTPLHYAAEVGSAAHAARLLERGCCPKPLDRNKRSPLDVAFQHGQIRVIEYLVEIPEAKHRRWSDRLSFAVSRGQPEVVRWLLVDRGANPRTKRDPYGRTIIELAQKPFRTRDFKLDGYTEKQIKSMSQDYAQVREIIEAALKPAANKTWVDNPLPRRESEIEP